MFHKILQVNKMLWDFELKGAKGRKDFLHKYHVIMKYIISTRMGLTKNESRWAYMKVEG